MVRQMDGAIGYVEFIYASQNDLTFGTVKNAAGRFVKASLETMNQAGSSVDDIPADLRVSITNAPGIYAYPICSYTWLLVPKEFENSVKAKDLAGFLRWVNLEGRNMAAQLGYAPLPGNMLVKVSREIAQIR
jgi:phosphate transport system substrate-binding protein